MIVTFLNRVYVDANIPIYMQSMGEHIIELSMGCSRGARLNKKVVVIKPKKSINEKIYDLKPDGVDLVIIKEKTIMGLAIKMLIWVVSMSFIRFNMRHIYSWIRTKTSTTSKGNNDKLIYRLINSLINILHRWSESKFYRTQLYQDRKDISNGAKFNISYDDIAFSVNYLKKKNIVLKNKLICIHVRDHVEDWDGYRRSCVIDNYLGAIKYLASKGYSIVKIGLGSEEKCNDPNIIDLSYEETPRIVPMYLISQCEFVVSYQTGFMQHLTYMLNKPLLMLNLTDPIINYPIRYNSMAALKTLIRKDTGEEANFSEFANGSLIKFKKQNKFDSIYEFIDNTENEVIASIKDMIDFIEKKFKMSNEQIFFRKFLLKKNIELLEKKRHIGVYNYYMKWSGGNFIGDGSLCPWYVEKKKNDLGKSFLK
ncbi:TIGR04372 family glycosyltransferase [bacterium]|nr:TIGR04372 family glycosyltransferase [bacterium]